jgi:hypothetical protein
LPLPITTLYDVEHVFGVLEASFTIMCGPTCAWNCETLNGIMKVCIVLRNMIFEDEQNIDDAIDFKYEQINKTPHVQVSRIHTL